MKNIERLAELLHNEIDAYSRLLQIEREKEEAIMDNDPAKLLEVLEHEEPAVQEANTLELQILECRNDLARELNEEQGVTLREIIARLEPPISEQLEHLRVKLFGFADEIRKINKTNYLLLKQSVELLNEVVNAVLNGSAACNTYGGSGRLETEEPRRGLFSVEA